jgi:hypothetical protein
MGPVCSALISRKPPLAKWLTPGTYRCRHRRVRGRSQPSGGDLGSGVRRQSEELLFWNEASPSADGTPGRRSDRQLDRLDPVYGIAYASYYACNAAIKPLNPHELEGPVAVATKFQAVKVRFGEVELMDGAEAYDPGDMPRGCD